MLIQEYGLFWRADEIDWNPGKGKKNAFRLLGRQGKNKPVIRIADFRQQRGVYILYGNYGPHYVGLTLMQDLGKRLKDHLGDAHAEQWDRFSWFGFRQVLWGKNETGIHKLKSKLPLAKMVKPGAMIRDIEALLIKSMALQNKSDMQFQNAGEWHQIKLDEVDYFLAKL